MSLLKLDEWWKANRERLALRGDDYPMIAEAWQASSEIHAAEINRLLTENAMLRTLDSCERQCEGTAYRIEARGLKAEVARLREALQTLVDRDDILAFKYLDQGIGHDTSQGKAWLAARAALQETADEA